MSKFGMTRKRALDFALYICIALAFGFLCVVFVARFWIVFLVGLAIRVSVAIFVVQHMTTLRAAWVGDAFVVEAIAYIVLLDAAVPRSSARGPVRKRRLAQ